MGVFDVEFPDDFLSEVLDTEFSEIAEEALKETGPIFKRSLQSAIKHKLQHGGDSELVNSIKVSKPRRTRTDAWIVTVGPSGSSRNYYYQDAKRKRKYNVSNVLKAIWLEYGRVGQPARPFLKSASENVRGQITSKLQDIYNKKVGGR